MAVNRMGGEYDEAEPASDNQPAESAADAPVVEDPACADVVVLGDVVEDAVVVPPVAPVVEASQPARPVPPVAPVVDPVKPASAPPAPAVQQPAGSGGAGGGGGGDGGGSSPDQLPEATWGVKTAGMVIVILYGLWALVALVMAFVAARDEDDKVGYVTGRWEAMLFAAGTVGAGLGVIQFLNGGSGPGKGYGVFRPLIGKDRRFSTSLTQVGLWTVAACTGFAYLLGRVMFEDKVLDTVMPGDRWDQYLLLLGGPFAGAVLAKTITTYKLQDGSLQKSEPTTTTPSQVVKSDDGTADLVDAQYLLFNVVALGYFVVQLISTNILPEIPAPLLALTGATAAAFVGNKAAAKNAPTVTSVSPTTVEFGRSVTFYGTNFDPGDKQDPSRRVTVALTGYTETIQTSSFSDTSATFSVPWGAQAGHQTVRVTTTAGVQSEPHDIEIRAKDATVTGISAPGALRPGSRAVLVGRNLGAPGEHVAVTIDTMLADATPNADGTALAFVVPAYLPNASSGSLEVKLAIPGQSALTFSAPIEQPRVLSAWRQDDHLEMRAAGLSGSDVDFVPRVLVNARTSPEVKHLQNDLYSVTLPADLDIGAELAIVVFDDIERKTAEYKLGK